MQYDDIQMQIARRPRIIWRNGFERFYIATESQMIEKARQKVLASTTQLSLAELTKSANVPTADMDIQLSAWKKAGALFGVSHEEIELFPA